MQNHFGISFSVIDLVNRVGSKTGISVKLNTFYCIGNTFGENKYILHIYYLVSKVLEGESQNLQPCDTACWGRIWIKSKESEKTNFLEFKK